MCLQTQVGHNKGGVGETRTHQKNWTNQMAAIIKMRVCCTTRKLILYRKSICSLFSKLYYGSNHLLQKRMTSLPSSSFFKSRAALLRNRYGFFLHTHTDNRYLFQCNQIMLCIQSAALNPRV